MNKKLKDFLIENEYIYMMRLSGEDEFAATKESEINDDTKFNVFTCDPDETVEGLEVNKIYKIDELKVLLEKN